MCLKINGRTDNEVSKRLGLTRRALNQCMKRSLNKIYNCSDNGIACLWYNMNGIFVTGGNEFEKVGFAHHSIAVRGRVMFIQFYAGQYYDSDFGSILNACE